MRTFYGFYVNVKPNEVKTPNSAQDQNGDAAEDLSAENVEPNDTLNSEEHVNRTSDGAQSNE